MERAGVSIEQLAAKAGVHKKHVSRWRSGSVPHENQLATIAEMLERSRAFLRYGVETAADLEGARREAARAERRTVLARVRAMLDELEAEGGAAGGGDGPPKRPPAPTIGPKRGGKRGGADEAAS